MSPGDFKSPVSTNSTTPALLFSWVMLTTQGPAQATSLVLVCFYFLQLIESGIPYPMVVGVQIRYFTKSDKVRLLARLIIHPLLLMQLGPRANHYLDFALSLSTKDFASSSFAFVGATTNKELALSQAIMAVPDNIKGPRRVRT